MFRLRIEGGPRNGEAISLSPGKTLLLGRGREADIRFPEDATMSRIQAELSWDGSAWTLGNKSQHGTLVSGQRVDTSKVLSAGDALVLGGTLVVFEGDPSGSPTMAPRPVAPVPTGSRVHAELSLVGSAWVLRNRSKHGTYVGAEKVDGERLLRGGDEIAIGSTRLIFEPDPTSKEMKLEKPIAPLTPRVPVSPP